MAHVPSAVSPDFSGQTATPISPLILPSKTIYPSKTLRCDVVFGSPSMDCNGTGICKLDSSNYNQQPPDTNRCQHTFGLVSAGSSGKISLFFFREFLCMQLYRRHFRKGILTMKEACPLPSEISNGLNISEKELLPGHYTVIECDGYYRVDVDCA